MSDPEQPKEPATPPPLKQSNLLDSVFNDAGPMPPARFKIRALAFVMDFILLTAVASVIIWKIAMPQAHPGAFAELKAWTQEINQWVVAGENRGDMPQPTGELTIALVYGQELQLMIFWLYFVLGEALFAGTTLGKRACRLRSVSTVTLGRPPILAGIVRGSLKTFCIFFYFPLGLLITIGGLHFNRRRQMAHDLLSRTAVIDEKYVRQRESN